MSKLRQKLIVSFFEAFAYYTAFPSNKVYSLSAVKEKEMFEINYLIDDEDLVMYERKLIVKGEKNAPKTVGVEHRSYHVYGQKVINGITYEVRSRDEGYEKVIIELMAKSIRSLEKKNT